MLTIISKLTQFLKLLLKPLVKKNETRFYLKDRFPEFAIGEGTYGSAKVLKYGSSAKLVVGSYTSIADEVTIFLGSEHRPDWERRSILRDRWKTRRRLSGRAFRRRSWRTCKRSNVGTGQDREWIVPSRVYEAHRLVSSSAWYIREIYER